MIADDQRLFRQVLKRGFESNSMAVVATVSSGDELLESYRRVKPDVVVVDILMPGMEGTRIFSRLFRYDPTAKVVVLPSDTIHLHQMQSYHWPITGFFSKNSDFIELVNAIDKIYTASVTQRTLGTQFSADIAHLINSENDDEGDQSIVKNLSKREIQIFSQLLNGRRTVDIAESFFISPKTVSVHKSNIMKKLGVRNNLDLLRIGMQFGMVESAQYQAH